jgi:hypothetical protein
MQNQVLKYAIEMNISKGKSGDIPLDVYLTIIDTSQKITIKVIRSFTNNSKVFKELVPWVKIHHKELKLSIVYLIEANGAISWVYIMKI